MLWGLLHGLALAAYKLSVDLRRDAARLPAGPTVRNELGGTSTVEAHGGVYLSTWEVASDEQGHYRKSIAWAGKTGPMRAPDGHHYTSLGGSYVAARIADELERRGLLPPATKP